ncbi:MAG: hypothetical protein AB1295_03130 [Candidatus Micrarchaeota archaeon]
MRAFIFSLDAFVAFTLALLAIYSLIFFSSVPSAYYYLLTQAHYLSRDTLLALSTTACSPDYGSCAAFGSVLDSIVAEDNVGDRDSMIQSTVGVMVPPQFGYALEVSRDQGDTWELLYDTADAHQGDNHARSAKKLTVSSQVISFGFNDRVYKLETSPYRYLSCNGDGILGGEDIFPGGGGWDTTDFGIIVCGVLTTTGGGGQTEQLIIGNTHPRDVIDTDGADLVPASDASIVRLTVFI